MKLPRIRKKRSKIFQVKTISKDVRKSIVPSFMFLSNLSKSVVLCRENVNIIQFSPLNEWNNEYTWFSPKIFVFYRKWEIKNVVVLLFLIKQGILFLHVSSVLGMCRGMHMQSHASYAKAWARMNRSYFMGSFQLPTGV